MSSDQKKPPETPAANARGLVINSSLFYLAMGVVGALVCYYHHHSLLKILAIPQDWGRAGYLVSLGLLGAGVLLVLGYFFEEYFVSFKSLRRLLMQFMGQLPIIGGIYLALISAVGEEILFRGAIQPSAGLFVTAILFGLLHLGPSRGISAWSLWAFLAGMLLGWIYQQTQSLWPSMIAHAVVNAFSLIRFRLEYCKFQEEQAKREQAQAESESVSGVNENQ